MPFRKIAALTVTSVWMLLVTASCSRYAVHRGPVVRPGKGPPPHARAIGHRRKRVCGMELVFDSGRGIYVVVGLTDHYYHDGYFYRLHGGIWQMSLKPGKGWTSVSMASLPPGLQAKGNGKDKSHGKHKKAS
ncbi:MAG: hypothetical protein JSW66_19030 [Phycisphaerales bacterium]|nr:MAG: hypothetical protein JSW66_19030 [Phycisphaerales bacterium]